MKTHMGDALSKAHQGTGAGAQVCGPNKLPSWHPYTPADLGRRASPTPASDVQGVIRRVPCQTLGVSSQQGLPPCEGRLAEL